MRHLFILCQALIIGSGVLSAGQRLLAYAEPSRSMTVKGSTSELKEGLKVLRPTLIQELDHRSKKLAKLSMISRDEINGAVRLMSGKFGQVDVRLAKSLNPEAAFVAAAEKFMNENPNDFISKGVVYRLNRDSIHISKAEQFLSFDVERSGILVWDAHVDFRFKFGQLVQVQNFSFNEVPYSARSNRSRSALKKTLKTILGVEAKFQRKIIRVISTGDSYRFDVMAEFSYRLKGETFLAQVSYADGDIFQFYGMHQYGAGTSGSMLYNRSWLDDAIPQPFPNLDVIVGASTVRTDDTGAFTFTGDSAPIISGLGGGKVKIVPGTGGILKLNAVRDDGSEGNYKLFFVPKPTTNKKTDKLMAQSMAYTHLNRIISRASQFINPAWFSKVLTANTSLNYTCNAFWDGSAVNFYTAGGTCANTALSADIVYHEWGHGLDQNTGGMVDGAFSEGYGDIMSLLMSNSPELGIGFYDSGKGLRELRTKKVYPRDITNEVHADGLIIASTFYEVLVALTEKYGEAEARELLANYAFKVIFTARRYTDVYNALLVIDDNDADLNNLTPNFCMLNTIFTTHGLARKDVRCTGT